MAVATTALVAGGLAVGGGIAKTISGAKQAKEARKALESFEMQDLSNPYENLTVSRLSADLQREEAGRAEASKIEALRQSGARGLASGMGYLQKEHNILNRGIGADLDRQRTEIDRMTAQDNARIRGMQEQRDYNTLSGLGQQLNVGRQDIWSGLGDISQSLMFMNNNMKSATEDPTQVSG